MLLSPRLLLFDFVALALGVLSSVTSSSSQILCGEQSSSLDWLSFWELQMLMPVGPMNLSQAAAENCLC